MKLQSKVALAVSALALSMGAAQATVISAPAGATFTVTAPCTVTGNIANLGNYFTSNTVSTVADRWGKAVGGTITAGTNAASPLLLATVNCPTGVAWNLRLEGSGPMVGNTEFKTPGGVTAFEAAPIATLLGAVPVDAGLATMALGLNGTGTGSAQQVLGTYRVTVAAGDTTTLPRALVAGTYTATNTARLDF